ncbi:MAG: hypothetical protein ACO2O2_05965 [Acidilobaceae archaeon]
MVKSSSLKPLSLNKRVLPRFSSIADYVANELSFRNYLRLYMMTYVILHIVKDWWRAEAIFIVAC